MSRPLCCRTYCPNCWRIDWHDALIQSLPARIALTVVTAGVFYWLRPVRCRTCGHVRPQHWVYRQVSTTVTPRGHGRETPPATKLADNPATLR